MKFSDVTLESQLRACNWGWPVVCRAKKDFLEVLAFEPVFSLYVALGGLGGIAAESGKEQTARALAT